MFVAWAKSFLDNLSNWRFLFAALAVILIGVWNTAGHLWAALLRNLEKMVGAWYQFRLKCAVHKAKFEARAPATEAIQIRLSFAYTGSVMAKKDIAAVQALTVLAERVEKRISVLRAVGIPEGYSVAICELENVLLQLQRARDYFASIAPSSRER